MASLLVIAGSWNGFSHEYRFATAAQSAAGANSRHILADLDKDGLPMSTRSLQNMMRNCAALIFDRLEVKLSDSLRKQVDQTCHNRASDILRRNASHPDAHAIALATTMKLDADAYRAAQAVAAYEPWPLQIRLLSLTRQPVENLRQDDVKYLLEQDINRALEAHWSRQILASLYLSNDDLAALIKPVAQAAPNDQQRAFLGALRRMTDSSRG